MSDKTSHLIWMINSRIMHDLSGSVSVLNSGMELYDHRNKSIKSQARELAQEEIVNLINRIKVAKSIFTFTEQEIGHREMMGYFEIICGQYRDNILIVAPEDLGPLPYKLIKVVLCLLQLYVEFLQPQKEHITVKLAPGAASINISEIADSDVLNIEKLKTAKLDINNCLVHYIYLVCQEEGIELQEKIGQGIVKYIFNMEA